MHKRLFIFLLFISSITFSHEKDSLYLGVIIKNNDALIPYFLQTLEDFKYEKKNIIVRFEICSDTPSIVKIIERWINKQQDHYHHLSFEVRLQHPLCFLFSEKKTIFMGDIKNDFLKKAKDSNCKYCFILESDAFLTPFALNELIAKDKPIISPVLRPVPGEGDSTFNFFVTGKPNDILNIALHMVLGVFEVNAGLSACLIQSPYFEKISFRSEKNYQKEELALAENLTLQKLPCYITNEKEFGFFLHFQHTPSLEEEKKFILCGIEKKVTPPFVHALFKDFIEKDPDLKNHIYNLNLDNYSIYRVGNRDLFYVDELMDWIKTFHIKRGIAWEPNISEILKKYTKPGSVALDIGGHIGTHTLTLSKLVGENGQVHVFEPQVKLFSELVINMALNDRKNILFHRCALGNSSQKVILDSPCPTNEGLTFIVPPGSSGKEKVQMIRLDELNLSNVSIIKMDVENYELHVLKGGKETIARNKPVLVIEIQGSDVKEKKELVRNMGYSIYELGNNDHLCLPIN